MKSGMCRSAGEHSLPSGSQTAWTGGDQLLSSASPGRDGGLRQVLKNFHFSEVLAMDFNYPFCYIIATIIKRKCGKEVVEYWRGCLRLGKDETPWLDSVKESKRLGYR